MNRFRRRPPETFTTRGVNVSRRLTVAEHGAHVRIPLSSGELGQPEGGASQPPNGLTASPRTHKADGTSSIGRNDGAEHTLVDRTPGYLNARAHRSLGADADLPNSANGPPRESLRDKLWRQIVADAPPDYDEVMATIPRIRPVWSLVLITVAAVAAWALILFAITCAFR